MHRKMDEIVGIFKDSFYQLKVILFLKKFFLSKN